MKIEAHTGAITLPSGFVLHRTLKMDAFRASGLCESENIYNPGTPWYYHRFRDGDFEGQPLGFVVCFYENQNSRESALTHCSFAASRLFDPAKRASWDDWSLEEDAAILELNRGLLKQLLGNPHRFQKNMSEWEGFPIFQTCALYDFKWGKVWCGSEDIKSNVMDTGIGLRYIANDQWARDDYEQYRKRLPTEPFWKKWKR